MLQAGYQGRGDEEETDIFGTKGEGVKMGKEGGKGEQMGDAMGQERARMMSLETISG